MTRPFYEQETDRVNEREVVLSWLKNNKNFHVKKLRTRYVLDFGVFKSNSNEMVCAVEVRCRDVMPDTYPDIMCNLLKHRLAEVFDNYNIPTYFLVRFKNGDIYAHKFNLDKGHYTVKYGGRTDRNDWEDMEPILCIPMAEFKKV